MSEEVGRAALVSVEHLVQSLRHKEEELKKLRGELAKIRDSQEQQHSPKQIKDGNGSRVRSNSHNGRFGKTQEIESDVQPPITRLGSFFAPRYDEEDIESIGEDGFETEEQYDTDLEATMPDNKKTPDSLKALKVKERKPGEKHTPEFHLLLCNDKICRGKKVKGGIKLPYVTHETVKMKFHYKPQNVFIVKKRYEKDVADVMLKLAEFLVNEENINVFVEDALFNDPEEPQEVLSKLIDMNVKRISQEELALIPLDFSVAIGGDGTIIWLSRLFPRRCPPVISVHMGSLGFLSAFAASEMVKNVQRLIYEDVSISLRSRLEAKIWKRGKRVDQTWTALNEVVVYRGKNSSLINCDLHIGKEFGNDINPSDFDPITRVQGDGLIVSTTTGSTAYSLSAGGSMTHPAIPCVVITPICPHTLSFRPVVVPDTSAVTIQVSADARGEVILAFDGKEDINLERGDFVVVTVSKYPVPSVCARSESHDWFRAIKESFNWNERKVQKALQSTSTSTASLQAAAEKS